MNDDWFDNDDVPFVPAQLENYVFLNAGSPQG